MEAYKYAIILYCWAKHGGDLEMRGENFYSNLVGTEPRGIQFISILKIHLINKGLQSINEMFYYNGKRL